jgi:hypothetical protein
VEVIFLSFLYYFLIKGAKGVARNKIPKQNIDFTGNMGSKYAVTGDASTDVFGAALRYPERT